MLTWNLRFTNFNYEYDDDDDDDDDGDDEIFTAMPHLKQ